MILIKIPKRIKVGGHIYRIKTDRGTQKRLEAAKLFGQWDSLNQEIRLYLTSTPDRLSHTFIHETLHAIDDVYCNSHLSEDDIDALCAGLHQVLEQLKVRFVK